MSVLRSPFGKGDSQLRVELARGTALLALTSITTAVAAFTVATVAATATTEGSTALLITEHTAGRRMRALLLDVGGRNDLGGEVEPLAQVVQALGGQGVVVCSRGNPGQSRRLLNRVRRHCRDDGPASILRAVIEYKLRTVLPRELGLDIATAVQGLHGLDDKQVLDGDLRVLGEVVAREAGLSVP